MAISTYFNRVQFIAASPGTGDFVVASGQTGFRTPAAAGVPDASLVSYVAINPISSNPVEWETGQGTYTVATSTLARTTVRESSNGNALTNFSAPPLVFLDLQAQDIVSLAPAGANTTFQYNNAGAFGGLTGFTCDPVNIVVELDATTGGTDGPFFRIITPAAAGLKKAIQAALTINSISFVSFEYGGGFPGFVIGDGSNPRDVGISRVAAGILAVNNGITFSDSKGFMSWAGHRAVRNGDVSVTSSTVITVGNLPDILIAVPVWDYSFEAVLFCTCAAAGGFKITLDTTDTLAVANFVAEATVFDGNTVIGGSRITALGSTVLDVATTGVVPRIEIKGHFNASVAGTFAVNFAQHASNATASVVKNGSYMRLMATRNG
jgi:hypothetical protein